MLAQTDVWSALLPTELIIELGVPAFIVVSFVVIGILWMRGESARIKANAIKVETEARSNEKQTAFALQTAQTASEQVGDMQTILLTLSNDLGEAKTQIGVLKERETTREQLWDVKFQALKRDLEQRDVVIKQRDRTIATIEREKHSLTVERDRLLKDNNTLLTTLTELSEKVAVLEAKLQLYEDAARRYPTQPIPDMSDDNTTPLPDLVIPAESADNNSPTEKDDDKDIA